MVTQIEQDAFRVLDALAEWAEGEDDPQVGRHQVSGQELQAKVGIAAHQINDAVEYLVNRGYVERRQFKGTAPYLFGDVWLTTEGRLAYQQAKAQATQPSPDQQGTDFQYDVFLSHSSSDDALATDVKKLLEANGIRTFATPGSIPAGLWQPQIEEALQTSATIWVLLTRTALHESVWAHHEFGYFYGYGHGKGRDLKGDNCRFLYAPGTELKGLYEHFQGTGIESFEDPVAVARAIAEGLDREFRVPLHWTPRRYPQQLARRHGLSIRDLADEIDLELGQR